MNVLLIAPDELAPDGTVALTDERATHLRTVLKVEVGQRIRAGIARGGLGTAEVLAVDGGAISLRIEVGAASVAMPV